MPQMDKAATIWNSLTNLLRQLNSSNQFKSYINTMDGLLCVTADHHVVTIGGG